MTGSDSVNCDGSAHAHNGVYQWSLESTVLFQSDHSWQYRPSASPMPVSARSIFQRAGAREYAPTACTNTR